MKEIIGDKEYINIIKEKKDLRIYVFNGKTEKIKEDYYIDLSKKENLRLKLTFKFLSNKKLPYTKVFKNCVLDKIIKE